MENQIYVFIDNSFLFIEGYKHVRNVAKLSPGKTPYVDYFALRKFIQKSGELRRTVICGSDLPGSMISKCQSAGFEVFTFPKYPSFKTGNLEEKGIDLKIAWEIAKTLFTSRDPVQNKKIILCTGDKDFMSIFHDIQTCNWAFEILLWSNSYSKKFVDQAKVFGNVRILDEEWKQFIKIGDAKKAIEVTGVRS